MKETVTRNMKTGAIISDTPSSSVSVVDNRTFEEKKAAVLQREAEREAERSYLSRGRKPLTYRPFAGMALENGKLVRS